MNERKVKVIKLEIKKMQCIGNFVDVCYGDMDCVDFSDFRGVSSTSFDVERLPIFTITESKAVPPLKNGITDRSNKHLIDQGFTRNLDGEFGRDEVWTKKTNYAAGKETVKLAKIVLHDILKGNENEIASLLYSNELSKCYLTQANQEIERLQQSIKTATLWQRVKYLFGGEL